MQQKLALANCNFTILRTTDAVETKKIIGHAFKNEQMFVSENVELSYDY